MTKYDMLQRLDILNHILATEDDEDERHDIQKEIEELEKKIAE